MSLPPSGAAERIRTLPVISHRKLEEHRMFEFLGKGMLVIFLIGLAVVIGVLMLIF